ncbi:MAG: hypothetical protein ACRDH2_04900 [Anaerolineales bacterium]
MNNTRRYDYWALWAIALISLVLNLLLIRTLLDVRRQVGEGVAQAAQEVGKLRQASIDYTLHLEESLPVSLTIPFSATFSVPISVTLPISTNVNIPLDTPFGTLPLNVPIRTTIPVNLQPRVPINLAVPISTTVPVVLEVPIQVALSDTAFGTSLAGAQSYLQKLSADLLAPPLQRGR